MQRIGVGQRSVRFNPLCLRSCGRKSWIGTGLALSPCRFESHRIDSNEWLALRYGMLPIDIRIRRGIYAQAISHISSSETFL